MAHEVRRVTPAEFCRVVRGLKMGGVWIECHLWWDGMVVQSLS